jgi:hypothetical protein
VFNGDIGTIKKIDPIEKKVSIRYDDRLAYDYGELDEISLAYAITIHKSLGSEFPAVVIPFAMQHFMMLQRNLIYTGISFAVRALHPRPEERGFPRNQLLIRNAPKKIFLILDNLRVHHAKIVQQWLAENSDKIEVFYLPSYSPELNPDELLNADLKQRVTAAVAVKNKSATRQDHVQGPAQHPETARQGRTLLPPPGCEVCRLNAVLSCRINRINRINA